MAGKFLLILMSLPTCVMIAPKKQGHVVQQSKQGDKVVKVLFGQPLINMRQDMSFTWVGLLVAD